MNEESLCLQANSPFREWALSEATSNKDNQCNYGSVEGNDYCSLSMKLGCGIIALEL